MKKLIILLLMIVLSGCSGGLTPVHDSDRSIKQSVDLPDQTKKTILPATRVWMEKYFTAAEQPIDHIDPAEGVIVGSGQIDYPCSWASCVTKGDWDVQFKLFVRVSDGRIEMIYRNLELVAPSGNGTPGMVGPVWSQRDMDLIRPELLKLNRRLVGFVQSRK